MRRGAVLVAMLSLAAAPCGASHHPSGRSGAPSAAAGESVVVRVAGVDPSDPVVLPLLGVISGPDPCPESPAPDLTPQLHDIGILTIRNNGYFDDRLDIEQIFQCPGGTTYPSWEGCDPTDDANYHWEASDAQFQSWLDGGFEPFLRLGGEAQCATRHHDFHGPQNEEQEANWIQAAIRVADRYLHWNGAEQAFTDLDIWTEWPNPDFWDRSQSEFCSFWLRAYTAVKERFPSARVGGPGFYPKTTLDVMAGHSPSAELFLDTLYRAGVRPDWLGWHLFSNHPEQFSQAARAYRQLLEGTGPYADVPWAGTGFFHDVELIADAWMISNLDQTPDGQQVELSPEEYWELGNGARGAAVDTASWINLQYSEVRRAYYYRCGDVQSSPDDPPTEGTPYSGLFYGDAAGTYKPRAHAVRLWSTVVRRYPVLLRTQLSSSTGPLWCLAATDGAGRFALLVANTGEEPISWQPIFSGAAEAPSGLDGGQVRQVDGADDGRTPRPFHGWPLAIPGETVQLVTLGPALPPTE